MSPEFQKLTCLLSDNSAIQLIYFGISRLFGNILCWLIELGTKFTLVGYLNVAYHFAELISSIIKFQFQSNHSPEMVWLTNSSLLRIIGCLGSDEDHMRIEMQATWGLQSRFWPHIDNIYSAATSADLIEPARFRCWRIESTNATATPKQEEIGGKAATKFNLKLFSRVGTWSERSQFWFSSQLVDQLDISKRRDSSSF